MKDNENANSWFDVEREFGHAYVMTGKFGQGILSEFVGTYLVALVGLYCAIRHGVGESDLGVLEVALGFSIPYLIYGRMIEGKGTANLNPVLSLTSLFLGYSSVVYCFASFMAQLAGFCFAMATLSPLDNLHFTLTLRPEGQTPVGIMFAECVGCLPVVCCKFGRNAAPYHVALAIFIATCICMPYSGGAVNPARAFGPMIALDYIPDYYWAYWLGPILASVLGTIMYFSGILYNTDVN